MKIKELIANLQKLDPNCDVVLSSDNEGNSYRLLSTISDNSTYTRDAHIIEVGLGKLTPSLQKMGYTQEDVLDGKPCIILS
jgi:hypothetical protein